MNSRMLFILLPTMLLAGLSSAETPRHPEELSFEPIEFEMAEAERDTLSSGIPVFLYQDESLPLLSISIRFRMGLRYLPEESFAAARLLGSVWRDGGTESIAPDSLDERLAGKNIRISAWSEETSGGVSVSMVSEDLHEGLELWREVLLRPGFDEGRLERAKGKRVKFLQTINNSPGRIADRHFSYLVDGESYPGNYLESKAEIESVTADELRGLHRRFVHPRNALIGVSGDFQGDEILALLDEVLSGWEVDAGFSLPVRRDWTPRPEPGVYILPGEYAQSQIRVGRKVMDLDLQSADYAAATIQNYAVGFGRIFFHTRQEGLSYGCGLILDVGDEHSTLRTLGSCRPEVTVQLIEAVLEEARGGGTDPLSDEEIETSRNFLIGDVIQRNERARDIVSQSLHDLVNDRPADHLERYFETLKRADREGIQRCGRDYNHLADSLVVLVLGDPSKFETPLESLGLGPVRELEPIRFGE